ncbi:MAG: glycosyl transferase, partial [Pseudomonadota bacterium]
MTTSGKVLFYVQHLLGVGHVFRSMRIVAGLVADGFDVELIYGGQKLDSFRDEGAKVHFLPPLYSDKGDFSKLITADGSIADDLFRDQRRKLVLQILEESQPDVIITEAFPFGRRQMHFELLPLMDA